MLRRGVFTNDVGMIHVLPDHLWLTRCAKVHSLRRPHLRLKVVSIRPHVDDGVARNVLPVTTKVGVCDRESVSQAISASSVGFRSSERQVQKTSMLNCRLWSISHPGPNSKSRTPSSPWWHPPHPALSVSEPPADSPTLRPSLRDLHQVSLSPTICRLSPLVLSRGARTCSLCHHRNPTAATENTLSATPSRRRWSRPCSTAYKPWPV